MNKKVFFVITTLLFVFCQHSQAQKTVYIPGSWAYNAATQEYIEGGNPALSWSYNRSKQSDHCIIFWMPGFGADPTKCEPALAFDPDDVLRVAEDCYNLNVNTLGFKDTPYKIIILMNYDTGWVCYGGGYDFRCSALWLSPSTVHPAGGALAHEVGHAFHYMSYGVDSNGGADWTCWTGFHGAVGNGSTTWEATAQWQSINVFPWIMFGESYPLFGLECNYAQTHEWYRYQSFWWFTYLCQHYNDIKTVSGVWNYHETEIKDFNQVLMDFKKLSVNDLFALYFDYAMRCATFDYTVAEPWRNDFIGNFAYHYVSIGQDMFQVAYASVPQSTGFNVIELEKPADGTTVTTEFTALSPGCQLAEGDPGLFYNGTPSLFPVNKNTYNSMNAAQANSRGFRVGYVFLKNDGTREYYNDNIRHCTGTGVVTENITTTVPNGTARMWLVVAPAPSMYIQHLWDEDINNDDQWPYQVKFKGTGIPGARRYYLYDPATDSFLSRGGNGGQMAVTDGFGLPVSFSNSGNFIAMQMADNNTAWLGGLPLKTNSTKTLYSEKETDNGTVYSTTSGKYLTIDSNNSIVGTDNENNATHWQIITSNQRNKIIAERLAKKEKEIGRLANVAVGKLSLAQHAQNEMTATDMTYKINNPELATNTNGWTVSGVAPSPEANVQEVYQGTGTTLSQNITGLPKGLYKVSLYAFYRDGWPNNCVGFANTGFSQLSNAWIKANDNIVQIADWAGQRGGDTYPNFRNEARLFFNDGKYRNDVYTFVGDDGKLNISFGSPQYIDGGWFCFANASLTYYGMNDELIPEYVKVEPDIPDNPQRTITGGVYYVRNRATGTYLAAANSFGTQASVIPEGLNITLTYKQNGQYTFNTKISNGTNLNFMGMPEAVGGAVYMDAAAFNYAITEADDGFYTISYRGISEDGDSKRFYIGYDGNNGTALSTKLTNPNEEAAQWQFLTRTQLIALLTEEAKMASESKPLDVTVLIQAQGFNRNDQRNTTAWKGSPTIGGNEWNPCAEVFNASFDVYQTLTGLPAGTYKVTAQGFYRHGLPEPAYNAFKNNNEEGGALLYANDESVQLASIFRDVRKNGFPANGEGRWATPASGYTAPDDMLSASTAFSAGFYNNELTFEVKDDGRLKLGFKKTAGATPDGNWSIFDNIHLYIIGLNSSTDIQAVNNDNIITNGDIYDLSGRRIGNIDNMSAGIPKGIYIINGKKVIIK